MQKFIVFLVLFLLSKLAFAEGGCPPGYFPVTGNGPTGCIPFPGSEAPPDPGPQWASNWGAIATASGGIVGVVNKARTGRKAEKLAMKDCKAKGGSNCRINLSYANQCAALAWGDNVNSAKLGSDAATAEANAMKSCSESTQNCKVYYSSCNYPERLR